MNGVCTKGAYHAKTPLMLTFWNYWILKLFIALNWDFNLTLMFTDL
jgi:hypothetical protein